MPNTLNITKELMTIEILNIMGWYKKIRENAETKNKFNVFSVKAQWALKKNLNALSVIAKSYEEFKNEKEQMLKDDFYFNDEKAYTTTEEQSDPQTGEMKEVEIRKIKDECLEEFQNITNKINKELNELLLQKNEVSLSVIDLDKELEEIGHTTMIDMDDFDVLEIFDVVETEDDKE